MEKEIEKGSTERRPKEERRKRRKKEKSRGEKQRRKEEKKSSGESGAPKLRVPPFKSRKFSIKRANLTTDIRKPEKPKIPAVPIPPSAKIEKRSLKLDERIRKPRKKSPKAVPRLKREFKSVKVPIRFDQKIRKVRPRSKSTIIPQITFSAQETLQYPDLKERIRGVTASGSGSPGSSGNGLEIPGPEESWKIWKQYISPEPLGLPSLTKLFYMFGRKGFDIIRGLLRLEVRDRGRNPEADTVRLYDSPEEVQRSAEEMKKEMKIGTDGEGRLKAVVDHIDKESWDDTKLLWVENIPLELIIEREDLEDKVRDSLTEEKLSYLLFTEKVPEEGPIMDRLQSVKKKVDKLRNVYPNVAFVRTGQRIETIEGREKLAKTFARILDLNRGDFELDPEELKYPNSIWMRLSQVKREGVGVGVESVIDNHLGDDLTSHVITRKDKVDKESNQHFAMKQVACGELLHRARRVKPGEKRWETDMLEWEEAKVEIEVEKYKEEIRPDLEGEGERGKVWVEAWTCRGIDNPLKSIRDRTRKIVEFCNENPEESPDELWYVFPYRKLFLYGEEKLRQFEDQIRKLKDEELERRLLPRTFLADFYDERLRILS